MGNTSKIPCRIVSIFSLLVMMAQRYGMSCLYLTQVYDWTGWKELEPKTQGLVTLKEKR